jgi:hypothetical protein
MARSKLKTKRKRRCDRDASKAFRSMILTSPPFSSNILTSGCYRKNNLRCVVAQIVPDPDWERQLSKLRKIVHNGLTEQGEFQGSKNQCEDELRRLEEQLKGYHKADEEYRTTLITVRRLFCCL